MTVKRLRDYCEAEFENIGSVLRELELLTEKQRAVYSTAELAAMATFVHNCYNGIENVLKRIIVFEGARTEEGSAWHKTLLTVAVDRGIISKDLYMSLSNYLSFRHFFIHAYSFTLRWEDFRPLVEGIANTVDVFMNSIRSHLSHSVDSHGLTPVALERLRDNYLANTSGLTAGVLCWARLAVGIYERV
jgi:hypothetical protein